MKVSIIRNDGKWHEYLGEILKLEGLNLFDYIDRRDISGLEADVAILPPGCEPNGVREFLCRGGAVVCFRPEKDILALARLQDSGPKPGTLKLRLTKDLALAGLGTDLPVLGPAATYPDNEDVPVAGYLLVESEFHSLSLGLVERTVGKGRLVLFAYDLPECVARIRQGEPERRGMAPEGDSIPRTCNLYASTLPGDAGWLPYADLHCTLLGDVVRRLLLGPVPCFWRLPGDVPGLVIFSGDDDASTPEMADWEMRDLEAMGGRMSLYMIPAHSKSTPEDVERWRKRGHEASVHPNLIPEIPDLSAMRDKLRQEILDFKARWGGQARTLRMHCLAWPGYTEPAEVLEEMGVQMESNFFSFPGLHSRARAPYSGMGAAMPLPFVRPDGALVRVWQQPAHLEDDAIFGKTKNYSQKLSPEAWKIILNRIFDNIARYFSCVYCVNIHPLNYVNFSGEEGREVMRAALERGFPILSMEQWLDFWKARDTWRFSSISRRKGRLSFTATGAPLQRPLSVTVCAYAGGPIRSVEVNGLAAPVVIHRRFLRDMCFIPIAPGIEKVNVAVTYHTGG